MRYLYVCCLPGFRADGLVKAVTARMALEAIPAEIEETIAKLDRKNKTMEKKGNDLASKRKMLEGLLEKL